MRKTPSSLTSLCIEALRDKLCRGDDLIPVIYELPSNLLDLLMLRLPPLILQKFRSSLDCEELEKYGDSGSLGSGTRKRKRSSKFDEAWRDLFGSRWPERVDKVQTVDWQQIYWETHLQKCLDEAAEVALLPCFNGRLSEVEISDPTLKRIGFDDHMKARSHDYKKLCYHFEEFGQYARSLSLQNVLCGPETPHLLRKCKLQSLVLGWIKSEEQIGGLCELLRQNCESLSSLEFIYCKFSSASIDQICDSLIINSVVTHGIHNFSISTSKFSETNPVFLPRGLVSFLSSGRSLCSLKFTYNQLSHNFARMVLNTLSDVSSNVSILDLSENNITGWLSDFNLRSSNDHSMSYRLGKSWKLLRMLNIRGNNLDTEDVVSLRYALAHMPKLEVLDISDNPIEDDGIRCLLPYFTDASDLSPFAELHVDNCELSVAGLTDLINTLSTVNRPLRLLSIADNAAGSQVASALGNLLSTSIQVLNISGIGMGSRGFQDLRRNITGELKLVEINISKNRGGIATAEFLSTLLLQAPKLVSVNAAYNLMPIESSYVIRSALKTLKGSLEVIDLRGNNLDIQTTHGLGEEIRCVGRPVLILSSYQAYNEPHDDDP